MNLDKVNVDRVNVDKDINKNIKYKTLFYNHSSKHDANDQEMNLSNLDKFLEDEKVTNSNEPWSKLDKTCKIKKLLMFADTYKETKQLSEEEYSHLIAFFKDCLDKKKLQRVKDVIYDKNTGLVKDIPALFYNKQNNHFTLKNIDKRVSTIKSLAPKKINSTFKNINPKENNSDNEEEITA
jgi:hypothetical protein